MSTTPPTTRRSGRNVYDSNGREYLCSVTGWTRETLDEWLTSDNVRTHLRLWYHLCMNGDRRFNDAIEWINTGDGGYFYNESDLHEDLMLMCLQEGNPEDAMEDCTYASTGVATSKWITQEIWARTAWRVVQGNVGTGEAFGNSIKEHPAAAYAFVIDILCLAFHSIAFRGHESIWEVIINGDANGVIAPLSPEIENDVDPESESDIDMEVDVKSEAGSVDTTVYDEADDDSDYFIAVKRPVTPKPKSSPRQTVPPKAPKKSTMMEIGDNIAVSANAKVKRWMDSVSGDEMDTASE